MPPAPPGERPAGVFFAVHEPGRLERSHHLAHLELEILEFFGF
jgi:hypothetical protein